MARQYLPDNFALPADAFSVNNSQNLESPPICFEKVFFNYGFNVAGRDGVEVENV